MVISIVKLIAGILITIIFIAVFFMVFSFATGWSTEVNVMSQLENFLLDLGGKEAGSKEITLPSVVEFVSFPQKIETFCGNDEDCVPKCEELAEPEIICPTTSEFKCCNPEEGGCSKEKCSKESKNCQCFYDKIAFDLCKRFTQNTQTNAYAYVKFKGKSPVCASEKNSIYTKIEFYDAYPFVPRTALIEPELRPIGCASYSLEFTTKESITKVIITNKKSC